MSDSLWRHRRGAPSSPRRGRAIHRAALGCVRLTTSAKCRGQDDLRAADRLAAARSSLPSASRFLSASARLLSEICSMSLRFSLIRTVVSLMWTVVSSMCCRFWLLTALFSATAARKRSALAARLRWVSTTSRLNSPTSLSVFPPVSQLIPTRASITHTAPMSIEGTRCSGSCRHMGTCTAPIKSAETTSMSFGSRPGGPSRPIPAALAPAVLEQLVRRGQAASGSSTRRCSSGGCGRASATSGRSGHP